MTYRVYDLNKKCFVGGVYKCFIRACNKVDKLDSKHGGSRYTIKMIKEA